MNDDADRGQGPPGSVTVGSFQLMPLLMVIVVLAAAAGIVACLVLYFLETDPSRRINTQFLFILLTLAGPVSVMVVVSVIYSAARWLNRWGG